ncbi:cytochrome P450 90D2 isoform X2 [Zea mays]|uniref:Cytochrome P450 90D2 n=1 Tax=Zea mays TaxID=4577 RepID=A0A1D6M079_MAIZE|nr:cytochrome P450 90D2 isoform X2 [Zea mays]AQK84719.1 Putative cytochrome P450 superfamily protein [Zea mays]|eukprot:XP_008649444.1 cytochrome P450 90D2 isoform X2 [Zea mays]
MCPIRGGGCSWPASVVGSATAALLLAAVIVRLFVPRACSSGIIKGRRQVGAGAAGGARLPAGSLGWPLLGETLAFIRAAYSPRPESFVEKRRVLYGKVFKSHLWGSPAVVSSDPEVSRAVLQADASAFVPWYPRSLMELMGQSSILVLGGGLQRRVHGLAGAFFKSPQLKAQVTLDMQRRVGRAMDMWGRRRHRSMGDDSGGMPVRVQNEAKSIVFEILVRALIGLEEGDKMQYLRQQFQEFIAGLISLPVKLPGTQLYRSLKAKKRMTKLIKTIIQEKRKKMMSEGDDLRGGTHPRDMIDVLLGNGNDELTDELISDNMIDFMIPAEDSVPVLITLAVKYLSECPQALQQLEEENMELKRQKSGAGETLEWTDYMSLAFTQHVITETLRMGNIINGIMRKAVRDVEVRGHLVPKGWRVLVYFRAVHLDAAVHDDPHAFNPWRWKERPDVVAMSGGGGGGFTPFGGGQRLCPGLDLARLEASIFLHHLVTNFRWVAEEDTVVNFPTVRLKRGMPIAVTPRTC